VSTDPELERLLAVSMAARAAHQRSLTLGSSVDQLLALSLRQVAIHAYESYKESLR
jgi:hypothetical protein